MDNNSKEIIGKVGKVTVSLVEDVEGNTQYLYEHEDGRWFMCSESEYDSEQEALEYASNFEHTYHATVDEEV